MRPYHDIATDYASQVLEGAIPVCRYVKLAAQRFLDDLENKNLIFSHAHVTHVCSFIEKLPHTKDDWQHRAAKKENIVLEPWQIFILANVFGLIRKEDQLRKYDSVMIVVPRKSGKSMLSAAVGLYMMVASGEHNSEVYCAASTEEQAWQVFKPARLQVMATPALKAYFNIQVNAKSLVSLKDGSLFHPVVGQPHDGASPTMAVIDEKHEHLDNQLTDALRSGMGARAAPLLWTITTAGYDVSSVCFQDVSRNRKILEKALDIPNQFYIEYSIDPEDDWTTEEALKKANPNYGISNNPNFLKNEQRQAVQVAEEQTKFLTKYLCVWCNAKNAFVNILKWNENYKDLKIDDFKKQKVYIGLDLAATEDFGAITLFIPQENESFVTFSQLYLPEAKVKAEGNSHYKKWEIENKIIVSHGNMNDFDLIEENIDQLMVDFDVQMILFDASKSAMLEQHLLSKDYPMESFTQTASNYTEPMRYINGLINANKLFHNSGPSDPVTWCMSNIISTPRRKELEYPDKEFRENKIDAGVALYMAVAGYLQNPPEDSNFDSLFY